MVHVAEGVSDATHLMSALVWVQGIGAGYVELRFHQVVNQVQA